MRAEQFHCLIVERFQDSGVIVQGSGLKAIGILKDIDDNFNVILSVGDRLIIFRRAAVIKRPGLHWGGTQGMAASTSEATYLAKRVKNGKSASSKWPAQPPKGPLLKKGPLLRSRSLICPPQLMDGRRKNRQQKNVDLFGS